MKARLSREDLIKGGFKEIWLYTLEEEKKEMEYYCFAKRLLIVKTFVGEEGMDYLLYGDVSDRKPLVVKEWIGNFETFKLLQRGIEVLVQDGSDTEWLKEMVVKESEWKKEISIRGRKKKQLDGGFTGGIAPYGYYNMNKKLYVDTYEKFVVEFVFYRRSQGCSKSGIAKELNLRKFKYREKPFSSDNVDSILKQKRFYQGYMTVDGVEIKGKHRPILSERGTDFDKRIFDEETEARILKTRRILTKEETDELKRSL